jgi:hypothetical protein
VALAPALAMWYAASGAEYRFQRFTSLTADDGGPPPSTETTALDSAARCCSSRDVRLCASHLSCHESCASSSPPVNGICPNEAEFRTRVASFGGLSVNSDLSIPSRELELDGERDGRAVGRGISRGALCACAEPRSVSLIHVGCMTAPTKRKGGLTRLARKV